MQKWIMILGEINAIILRACVCGYNNYINSTIFQSDMSKRVENQIRKRIEASGEIHKIEQLCLDAIQIKNISLNIKRLLESCSALEYLTMNDCELKSLENFPHLSNLIGLQLSDNMLTGEDLSKLSHCPQINFLTLDNNRISSISYINHLKKLPELQILEIHDNQICEDDNYRSTIFETFPNVSIVDCLDREGNQVEQENPSEYISNVETSRLDLLDLLNEEPDQIKQDFVKTALEYQEDSFIKRSDSILTKNCPTPTGFGFGNFIQQRAMFENRKQISFIRTRLVEDDSSEESNLIQEFKKHQKKEDD